MQSEAEVFQGHDGLQVLYGTSRNNLASLIPKDCMGLISAGTVGGLLPSLGRGDLVLGNVVVVADGTKFLTDGIWLSTVAAKVAHMDHHFSRIYSDTNTITQTPVQRTALAQLHDVAVDDEESWAVARTARALGLPFIVVRAVSDQWDQTLLPDDSKAVNPDGTVNVGPLIPDFFENPVEALLEAEGLQQALNTLRTAFSLLGPTFSFPGK
jgi:nucleoside phosphorylase